MLFNKNPQFTDFLATMRVRTAPEIDMQRYQAGIDNLHVDVVMTGKFQGLLTNLVNKIVIDELARLGYDIARKPLIKKDFDDFHHVYRDLMEGALSQSEEKVSMTDLVRLLQLALLKMLLTAPGGAIQRIRGQLKRDADIPFRDNDGRALELHERLVAVAKYEPAIIYLSLRRLFKLVQQIESGELRKIRKSVLGTSWVVPRQLLFSPLLHLPNLTNEEFLMNHYPIVCMDRDDEGFFSISNRLICETFADILPDWTQPVAREISAIPEADGSRGFQVRDREWSSGFSEFLEGHRLLEQSLQAEEFKHLRYSWLDTPENIEVWFQKSNGSQWLKGLKWSDDTNPSAGQNPDMRGLQKKLVGCLLNGFEKTGILRRVIASYRTPRLYHQLNQRVPIRDIYRYLSGVESRRDLLKHLHAMTPEMANEAVRALDTVVNYIKRMPNAKHEDYTRRYLKDFLCFRRDLKLAYFAHQKMSHIRLLENADDINLSKDNGALYEFRLGSETAPAEEKIRSHVVLKADIRGSTEITQRLMQEHLNPATHFSLNFFNPINQLLERFNTQKVFVEGDALILTVLEYAGMAGNRFQTVACACGLACKIISVMEMQNQLNRNNGLPRLELGLGITFCNDPPAYLYDDRRKIMISPAINQADRLSSCAAELRMNDTWQWRKQHAVEVLWSEEKVGSTRKLLRYNVNGIILDAPAFEKLKTEISMHKVHLKDQTDSLDAFYAGRFIDRTGTSHWLVIREAPIRVLQGDGRVVEDSGEAQFFYEVVTNSDLIGMVKSKLHSRGSSSRCRH